MDAEALLHVNGPSVFPDPGASVCKIVSACRHFFLSTIADTPAALFIPQLSGGPSVVEGSFVGRFVAAQGTLLEPLHLQKFGIWNSL
jgi:hypothetical protein